MTWVLYVFPFDIAVNSAISILPPNTVVHPMCEPDALAAHVYSTGPLQHKSVFRIQNRGPHHV